MNRLTDLGNGFTRCFQGIYSGLKACTYGFGSCMSKCCWSSLDATKLCFEGCGKSTKLCLKGCRENTKLCLGGCRINTKLCFKSCKENTKLCCIGCINCTKSCTVACCRPIKNAVVWIVLKIAPFFDWHWVGRRLPLVNFFLLCIPVRLTGYIVASGSFIYSSLCFSLVMTMAKHGDKYLEVYANKMDVFLVIVIYLSSTVPFMVTCIFLITGTFLKNRVLVELYLWSALLHILVNIVSTIGVSTYCIYNYECFNGSGLGQSVFGLVICFLYTMLWIYILSSINSMMENPAVPLPLSK